MTERELLVIERPLIERIDQHRGDVDREAFIRYCVESLLEGVQPPVTAKPQAAAEPEKPLAAEAPVSRPQKAEAPPVSTPRPQKTPAPPVLTSQEEFEEFKKGIRAVLRSFLDFYVTYGVEMSSARGPGELRNLKEELRSLIHEH